MLLPLASESGGSVSPSPQGVGGGLPILCRERSGVSPRLADRDMSKLTGGGNQGADTSAATCGNDLVLSKYWEVGGSIVESRQF